MARAVERTGFRVALALLLAVAVVLQAAGGVAAASRDRLEAFLAVTGFDVALESIKLSAEDAPAMLGLEAADFGFQWKHAAEEVFDVPLMQEMALDILAKALSDDLLTHAADFYATPLGMRLVAVENASHLVEDDDMKKRSGEALLEEMRSANPAREALIRRMNDAIDTSDTSVKAVQMIQYRFLLAASHAGVLDLKIDEGGLMALLRENEDEMRAALEQSALAGAAWTYRDFTDAEIEAYTEALEDERMRKVYELMNAIQWEIMANRFETLAGKLAGIARSEEL